MRSTPVLLLTGVLAVTASCGSGTVRQAQLIADVQLAMPVSEVSSVDVRVIAETGACDGAAATVARATIGTAAAHPIGTGPAVDVGQATFSVLPGSYRLCATPLTADGGVLAAPPHAEATATVERGVTVEVTLVLGGGVGDAGSDAPNDAAQTDAGAGQDSGVAGAGGRGGSGGGGTGGAGTAGSGGQAGGTAGAAGQGSGAAGAGGGGGTGRGGTGGAGTAGSGGLGGTGGGGTGGPGTAGSGGQAGGAAGTCGGPGGTGFGGRTGAGGAIDDPCLTTTQPFLRGDFDGDGIQDCVVLFPTGITGSVKLYAGLGNGKFPGTPVTSSADCLGQGPNVVADFDGDGRDDILTMGTTRGSQDFTAYFLVEHGDGTFACPLSAAAGLPRGARLADVAAIGDFDGDGRTDVFLVGLTVQNTNSVEWIWLRGGPPSCGQLGFQDQKITDATFAIGALGKVQAATASNLDADGHLDVTVNVTIQGLSGGAAGPQPAHVYGNGDGTFRCGAGETLTHPDTLNGCIGGTRTCQSTGQSTGAYGPYQCVAPNCICPLLPQ